MQRELQAVWVTDPEGEEERKMVKINVWEKKMEKEYVLLDALCCCILNPLDDQNKARLEASLLYFYH